MSTESNIQTVRKFLTELADFKTDGLQDLLTGDAMRMEWPNRLKPQGNPQRVDEMLRDAGKARAVLRAQRYDIAGIAANETSVMVEMTWTGTLAIPLGSLTPGDTMTAHCVAVFDFRDGRISSIRNYDCFEPF